MSRGEIRQTAEATGKIEPHVQVDVQPRASGEVSEVLVAEGDVVIILEAMKMENNVVADVGGTVTEVKVAVGDSVGSGDVVVVIEPG